MRKMILLALVLLGIGAVANTQFYVEAQDGTFLYKMDEGTSEYVISENSNSYSGTVGTLVDLGLTSGTLWADHNIGATNASDAGDYYQWGEVTAHYLAGGNTENPIWKDGYSTGYNWSTYNWCNGSYDAMTKYVPQSYASDYGNEGFYDDKVTLEKADDAASQTWGSSWVVPTHAQQEELYNECYWVWTNSYNGTSVHGYIVYKAKADDDKGTIVYDGKTPNNASVFAFFLPNNANFLAFVSDCIYLSIHNACLASSPSFLSTPHSPFHPYNPC